MISQLVVNMADGRAAKLRKLDASRRRLPYVSANALDAVYKDVLEHGVPEMRTRAQLIAAKHACQIHIDTTWQTAPAASSPKAEWASL